MLPMILSLVLSAGADMETYLADYFITYRGTNGLVQDRASTTDIFSIAATGFGMDAWAIKAVKGEMPPRQALQWISQALAFMRDTNPDKNRGWLYHFVDYRGSPQINSEVSTIDTAIFYLGARQAARRLKDRDLESKISGLLSTIDVDWMIINSPSGKLICHGLRWKENNPVFLRYEWGKNSEGVLAYRLFGIPYEQEHDDFSLPLFVYYYPMCFLPQDEFRPALQRAIDYQLVRFGHIGITSTDTQKGYEFKPTDHISPLSLYAISLFDPRASEELARHNLSPKLHSSHLDNGWKSDDRIGIDEGAALLLRHPLQ